MRTFIFVKEVKKEDGIHKIITGMVNADIFPSTMTQKDDKFYGCQCIEVTEECHVDLGRFNRG